MHWQGLHFPLPFADEYRQAADCLQSLLEFAQSEQASAFPDFQEQCLGQQSALQEVHSLHQHLRTWCKCTDQTLSSIGVSHASTVMTATATLLCDCTEHIDSDLISRVPSSERSDSSRSAGLSGCCHRMAGNCHTYHFKQLLLWAPAYHAISIWAALFLVPSRPAAS